MNNNLNVAHRVSYYVRPVRRKKRGVQ